MNSLNSHWYNIFGIAKWLPLSQNASTLLPLFGLDSFPFRFLIPYGFLFCYLFLHNLYILEEIEKAITELHGIVDAIIEERRDLKRHGTRMYLIDVMIDSQDEDNGGNLIKLTDLELRDNAIMFLLAGSETTATVLSFPSSIKSHEFFSKTRTHHHLKAST